MFRRTTLTIRPFELIDAPTLRYWQTMPDWPSNALGRLLREGKAANTSPRTTALIAENTCHEPIGIAQLTPTYQSSFTAQFSAAIPDPSTRTIGRGRDLLVLSLGAAFLVYRFTSIIVLIDSDRDWLHQMCRKGGFVDCQRRAIRDETNANTSRSIAALQLSQSDYLRAWGSEFFAKRDEVPWLMANCSHDAFSCAMLQQSTVLQPHRRTENAETSSTNINSSVTNDQTEPLCKVLG